MKKMTLVLAMVLIALTSATATTIKSAKHGKDLNFTKRYHNAQPIVFVERGVEFLIFPDGSFDFNTNYSWSYNNRPSRRSSANTIYSTSGRHTKYLKRRAVQIIQDRYGDIKRIGNVFINYDRRGKVKRIGSVFLDYNRGNGRLKQVGGLRVNYNGRGKIVHLSGQVNYFNSDFNCDIDYGFNDDYYYKKRNKKDRYKRRNYKN